MKSPIAEPLLRWYASRQRDLPWRTETDPYAVWVAEIMAQQTRVASMLPYFERWMQRFPTIASLADADEQAVLALWEGLGYYSRARNLQRAARLVMAEYGGQLPRRAADLQRLPGIGAYTAGAIASIAFGEDVPAVDGNAVRVLARLFNVDLVVGSSAANQRFWQLAGEHLPPGQAAAFNQALMDLGGSVCTPRNPQCPLCPLGAVCLARQAGTQAQRPVRAARKALPLRHIAAGVFARGGQVLLSRRPPGGLLGGLWEFPNVVLQGELAAEGQLQAAFGLGSAGRALGRFSHAYSHFKVELQAFWYPVSEKPPGCNPDCVWVAETELADLPMGKLDRSIARRLAEWADE